MNRRKADEIITEYLTKLYGFAIRKSFSYVEAEELCSDIICELYSSLLRADEVYNIDGYIWRISEYVYSKYVSSKKKHQEVSIDGMEIPFEDNYSLVEAEEELLRLRREIAFLTKTRREIVFSYYYENKAVSVISNEMNLPVGTVKWHLNKARNELKERVIMERKIGKLGLKPIKAIGYGHIGMAGANGGPEFYLKDSLNLNIVYSVYHNSRTIEEISEELGVTPVFIEDKIEVLENNGFLVRQAGNRFTTYVWFEPETYSLEQRENTLKKQLEIAELLAKDYAHAVRAAISDVKDAYIPSGNRELLEAAAIFYGVANNCQLPIKKDLSRYYIKTTDGGNFIARIGLPATQSDKDYNSTLSLPSYWSCGDMTRKSEKYPVYSWSIDTRYCAREGAWQNNLTSDYEYLYEFMTGAISDDTANADKFKRLRERNFITDDNKVNIMIIKGDHNEFFSKIPSLDEKTKKKFAHYALESAEIIARDYPPQMHDLVISWHAGGFVGNTVAIMVMDILYGNGAFKELTDSEKITSNLLMFCDVLPKV
ncbi:sigma-70 family RNA polymerase sigma factor [Pseudoclostridium thermosuccinogenes]|uniref:sigma-70 family RNA polymerase sigma factor n=1 Tax=Clostridium thermosuccinogenes TaxID=84032 RepID=UPI002FDB0C30